MRGSASLLLSLAILAGCAVGHVTPRGDVYGAALGRAKLQYCDPGPPATETPTLAPQTCKPPPPVCREITGGSLSVGAAEAIGSALSGLVAWWAAP